MSGVAKTSTMSKIVWNKLKSKINVLQLVRSWNPNFVKVTKWNCENWEKKR